MILLKLHQDYEVCHHSFVLMKMYTPENDVVLFLLHFWLKYMLLLLSFFSSSIKFKFKISFICVIIRYKLLPILFSNLMTMQLIKSSSVWFKESLKEKKLFHPVSLQLFQKSLWKLMGILLVLTFWPLKETRISPYNIVPKSNVRVTRVKEMITN